MGLFHPSPNKKGVKAALGAESEVVIAAELIRAGYVVWVPNGNVLRYDLVIEDANGDFWRVQCKTAWLDRRTGNEVLTCHTVSHHYHYRQGNYNHRKLGYAGQVDYFAIYSPDVNKVYLVPMSHVGENHHLSLRLTETTRNGQSKGVRYAVDYEL